MVLSLSLHQKQLHLRYIALKKLQFQVHIPIHHLQAFSVHIRLILDVNDLQIFDYYGEYNLILILLSLRGIQVIQSIHDLKPEKRQFQLGSSSVILNLSVKEVMIDAWISSFSDHSDSLSISWIVILSNNSSLYLLCAFFLPQSLLRN